MLAAHPAATIAIAVDGGTRPGTIYELGGPDVRTFRELMDFVLATIERRRLLDNVVSAAAKADGRTLEGLGITPELIGAVVPSYLWRFRKTGQFRGRIA